MSRPRLLVLLGSGETSPTMVTLHQQVLAALGGEVDAVALDTPFGFQENADELSARIVTYFADSVGRRVEVVSYRSRTVAVDDPDAAARAWARVARADWVFAGPGSPTYALDTWRGTPVVGALDDVLVRGGAVVFASAAALTLGLLTVPVYEVYKVGEAPVWRDGLDVLGRATGLRAAVVPHFDNAEGGTHDTRFCYLGERRLAALETTLPDGAFVLGLDEHTAAVVDLDTGSVRVAGRGGLSVRAHGRTTVTPTGQTTDLTAIAAAAGVEAPTGPSAPPSPPPAGDDPDAALRAVRASLGDGDLAAAVDRLLPLERADGDRLALRTAIAEVAEVARDRPVDVRSTVAPFVEALLAARAAARADRRFAEADGLRDQLSGLGVEVRDTPDGVSWELAGQEAR